MRRKAKVASMIMSTKALAVLACPSRIVMLQTLGLLLFSLKLWLASSSLDTFLSGDFNQTCLLCDGFSDITEEECFDTIQTIVGSLEKRHQESIYSSLANDENTFHQLLPSEQQALLYSSCSNGMINVLITPAMKEPAQHHTLLEHWPHWWPVCHDHPHAIWPFCDGWPPDIWPYPPRATMAPTSAPSTSYSYATMEPTSAPSTSYSYSLEQASYSLEQAYEEMILETEIPGSSETLRMEDTPPKRIEDFKTEESSPDLFAFDKAFGLSPALVGVGAGGAGAGGGLSTPTGAGAPLSPTADGGGWRPGLLATWASAAAPAGGGEGEREPAAAAARGEGGGGGGGGRGAPEVAARVGQRVAEGLGPVAELAARPREDRAAAPRLARGFEDEVLHQLAPLRAVASVGASAAAAAASTAQDAAPAAAVRLGAVLFPSPAAAHVPGAVAAGGGGAPQGGAAAVAAGDADADAAGVRRWAVPGGVGGAGGAPRRSAQLLDPLALPSLALGGFVFIGVLGALTVVARLQLRGHPQPSHVRRRPTAAGSRRRLLRRAQRGSPAAAAAGAGAGAGAAGAAAGAGAAAERPLLQGAPAPPVRSYGSVV